MNLLELFSPPVGQHDVLNPKLWEGRGRLRSQVQGALTRIADDFIKFCDVDLDVVNVVITGGNANYTYTTHSDIDLHIVADLSKVDCDREINELLDTKRLLYREKYDIKVEGIPVELYVEDIQTPAVSGGCYSIMTQSWIKEPQPTKHYDEQSVRRMVDVWHRLIKFAVKSHDATTARQVMSMLRQYRRLGLKTAQAEFSIPNLVFKSLRNDDTIRQLQQLLDLAHDRELSV